jgi:hypothetical protein
MDPAAFFVGRINFQRDGAATARSGKSLLAQFALVALPWPCCAMAGWGI